jgi:hypothetical protein
MKQLVSPHVIEQKYLSTKNDEIKAKLKHFDFSMPAIKEKHNEQK